MKAIHTTYLFATDAPADVLEQQCDALMQALLDFEDADPAVTDSTVSMSADIGVVEVEAFAEAATREEAEDRIADRILTVVDKVVGLDGVVERERRIELVDAG